MPLGFDCLNPNLGAYTVTRSPRRICIELGDRFDPLQRVALAIQSRPATCFATRRRTARERESATTRRNSRNPRARRRRRIIFILSAGAAMGLLHL